MIIKEAILASYRRQNKSNVPDFDLLFKVIVNFMKRYAWVYNGDAKDKNLPALPAQSHLEVNCFHLADLFVSMSIAIGADPKRSFRLEIDNFIGRRKNERIQGDYKLFSPTLNPDEAGLYAFNVHCIAMVHGACFDLVFKARYPLVNDGVDVFNSLMLSMEQNDLIKFKSLLPHLCNINEQDPDSGWTLLHQAIYDKKYSFARQLILCDALDNVADKSCITPLCILNMQIHSNSASVEELKQAKDFLMFKIDRCISNQIERQEAAITIYSFWKKHRVPTDTQSPAPDSTESSKLLT